MKSGIASRASRQIKTDFKVKVIKKKVQQEKMRNKKLRYEQGEI